MINGRARFLFFPPSAWTTISFSLLVGGCAVFSTLRVAFAAAHWSAINSIPTSELLSSFLRGVRFDIATSCQMALPSVVIAVLAGRKKLSVPAAAIGETMAIAPFLVGIFISLADIHYFTDSGRRLSYEVFSLGNDVGSVLSMVLAYPVTGLLALSSIFLLVWGWHRFRAFISSRTEGPRRLLTHIMWLLVLMTVIVVGLRGGLQSKPLRPSFAYFSPNRMAGLLALNPVFTVTHALRKGSVQVPDFMDSKAAVKQVQSLLHRDRWTFPRPDFPLYQAPSQAFASTARPNIVVMVLESWSAADVGALNGGKGVTPSFDALSRDGLLFENFFAVGHRSTDGITAVCLSLPTFEDLQIIGSSLEQNRYRGLGHLLREQGYSTLFLHGAKTGSMGLNGFARVAGFERYIGKEDFKLNKGDADGTWGVFDHVALHRLNTELRGLPQPFGALWFSLTSHSPYEVPSSSYRVTPKDVPDHLFMDAIRYSDDSLGEFFEAARKETYFSNTIFIIIADHTAGSKLRGTYERYRIPLLIYSPGRIQPGRVPAVGSQLDIIPTILDLTGTPSPHHAMGRSLLGGSRNRFAFVDLGGAQGWIERERLTLLESSGRNVSYDWKFDPYEASQVPQSDSSITSLKAYIQVAKRAVLTNRLCPVE